MAINFPNLPSFLRNLETREIARPTAAATPAAAPAPAEALSSELFADGFNGTSAAPVNLGVGGTAPAELALPSFKVGFAPEATLRNYAPASASESSSLYNGVTGAGRVVEDVRGPSELLGDANAIGQDVNLGNLVRASVIGDISNQIDQYSRVAPNLTGSRQTAALDTIDSLNAERAGIAAVGDGTMLQQLAGGFNEAVDAIPGARSTLNFLNESPVAQVVGKSASVLGGVAEGVDASRDGADLPTSVAVGATGAAIGLTPAGPADITSRLVAEGGAYAFGGDPAEASRIIGNGLFTSTGVDGVRAGIELGRSAFSGDTSNLEDYRQNLENGNIFERGFAAVGNFIGAGAASVATGSTQPLKDAASDTVKSFSTLGDAAQQPAAPAQPSIFDTRAPSNPGEPLPQSVLFGDPLPAPAPAAAPAAELPELPEVVVSAEREPQVLPEVTVTADALPSEEQSNPFSSPATGADVVGGGGDFGGGGASGDFSAPDVSGGGDFGGGDFGD